MMKNKSQAISKNFQKKELWLSYIKNVISSLEIFAENMFLQTLRVVNRVNNNNTTEWRSKEWRTTMAILIHLKIKKENQQILFVIQ